MYFEMAMMGLNLAGGYFAKKDNTAKKIYKEQLKSMELQQENLRDSINFTKEMAGLNMKDIQEAYRENYSSLIAKAGQEKTTVKEMSKQEEQKLLQRANGINVANSSFNVDMQNYMKAQKDNAIKEVNYNVRKSGENLSKEKSSQLLNVNATVMNAVAGNFAQQINVAQQGVNSATQYASSEFRKNQMLLSAIMNTANLGAGVYGDYRKSGSGDFWNWALK